MSVDEMITALREALEEMSDEERLEVISKLMDGYCEWCGRACDGRCHCMNDE